MDSCYEICLLNLSSVCKILHHGTEITIHVDPKPIAYYNVVGASYDNHCLIIKIDTTMAISSNTFHDRDTILASTLSPIQINYQGRGEYSLLDAFSIGALPLDTHSRGCPTYQAPKPKTTPQLKQLRLMIFFFQLYPQWGRNDP